MTVARFSPNASPARQRRGGLVAEVVEHFSQSIQSGERQPGDKLPTESAIMDALQVSRTVVREALSRLQASGLVETRHGIGTFVLAPTAPNNFQIADADLATLDDVLAVLELRISIETEAAALAAERATAEHIQALSNALQGFEQALEGDSNAVPNDFDYHLAIAKATGNRHFVDLLDHLGTRIIPRTRINTPGMGEPGQLAYLRRVHAEHERIYSAIVNRDAKGAREAMRTHLTNSRERLRKQREGLA
jgi:GntR family transcriptional repressor for pyruvate dehydrogenase complex